MSEESKVRRKGKQVAYIFMVAVLICATIFVVYSISSAHYAEFKEGQVQTKALTILHTWEEGGQYYFADELGCVYLMGCRDDKGEIRYDDMPKIRFDKLEEGHRYRVEYVLRQGNVRLSLGEKEMER